MARRELNLREEKKKLERERREGKKRKKKRKKSLRGVVLLRVNRSSGGEKRGQRINFSSPIILYIYIYSQISIRVIVNTILN